MDLQKAKQIAVYVEKQKRYSDIMKQMDSGYSDEWQFKNTVTGAIVDFTSDDWAKIKIMVELEFKEMCDKIEMS